MVQTNLFLQLQSSDARWGALIESIPQANIFHHPAWIDLLSECYRYRSFVLTMGEGDDKIRAGLPIVEVSSILTGRRWVSLPFTDYCQPLAQDQDSLEGLAQELRRLTLDRHLPRIEVRWELPAQPFIQRDSHFVRHTLRLDQDLESISKSLHRTQRQNIKTAEKNNVQIDRGTDLDHMRSFYALHCLTRRRQGVPVQPWRFFTLLHERLIARGLGFILLAWCGDKCLAAGLFLHWHGTLVYKYASSSEEGQDLRPNHLLTWTAIRWGCENGYKLLDFGRTDASNEGLRTFKNRWGAVETPLVYSTFSAAPPAPSAGRIESWMHKVIRNSPLWVCRSAGELLYRHFG